MGYTEEINEIQDMLRNIRGDGEKPSPDDIDISQIPIEDLKKGYKDYRLVPTLITYGHPLYSPVVIKEALGDIYPPDKACTEITKKYDLPSSFAKKMENHHGIFVYLITAVIGINDKMVEEDMNKLGYFLGARGRVQKVDGMKFQVLKFEPNCQLQNDITDEVEGRCNVLYHWTPMYNLKSVMASGLIPSHKNNKFNYPPRIYLIDDRTTPDNMEGLGQALCSSNSDQRNDGNYALLSIDVKNLDNNIRLFYDPNSAIGIFTEQPIPRKYIKFLSKMKFVNDLLDRA
jgi:hypothetical protein